MPEKKQHRITIGEKELTGMTDTACTILAEVRDVLSIPNLINLCREEGFLNLKKRYMGGLWVWIACESATVCRKFINNSGIHNVFSKFCDLEKEFVIKERMVLVEILSLPICAWNPCMFKKVAAIWGEVAFSDDNESNCMSVGKVCVKTKVMEFLNEVVVVEIGGKSYSV
ncbi:hypothetical protein LXL04_034318 [Taraxacum kok-saghyz]